MTVRNPCALEHLKRICSQTCKLFQPSLPYNKVWRNLFVPAILLPAKGLEQALGLQNDRRNKPKRSHIELTTDKIPLRVGVFPLSVTQKLKLSVPMAHGPLYAPSMLCGKVLQI